MKIVKLVTSLITVIFIAVIFCGCTTSQTGTIFSTSYQIDIEGNKANKIADSVVDMLLEYENLFSVDVESSDIYKINNAKKGIPVNVSEDTIYLIDFSKELYQKTDGQFNPSIYPLSILWGFAPSNYYIEKDSIPTEDEIKNVVSYCNMDNFIIDKNNNTITKLNDNAMLDFGGIAKGYAVDKATEQCKEQSSYLINIGGEISIGDKEKNIAIADPFDSSQYIETLQLKNISIATSGTYERYFTYNNCQYHHIIAKDGHPSSTKIISATVIAKSAALCDALATCALLLDEDNYLNLLHEYAATAIIITNDGQITRLNNE